MKSTVKSLLTLLSLGIISAAPLLRAQDNAAAPAAAPAPAPDAAAAPDNPPPPKKKKGGKQNGMLNQLKDKLNLTDDQVAKLGDIVKDQRAKGQAIREDSTLSDDDKRAKGQALMKDVHDQIRAMLTPDQQKTFDAMPPMGQRGGKRKKAPDADAPPPPPADAAAPAPAAPPAN